MESSYQEIQWKAEEKQKSLILYIGKSGSYES